MDLFVCEKWVARGSVDGSEAWKVSGGWASFAEARYALLQNGVQRGWPWSVL